MVKCCEKCRSGGNPDLLLTVVPSRLPLNSPGCLCQMKESVVAFGNFFPGNSFGGISSDGIPGRF